MAGICSGVFPTVRGDELLPCLVTFFQRDKVDMAIEDLWEICCKGLPRVASRRVILHVRGEDLERCNIQLHRRLITRKWLVDAARDERRVAKHWNRCRSEQALL